MGSTLDRFKQEAKKEQARRLASGKTTTTKKVSTGAYSNNLESPLTQAMRNNFDLEKIAQENARKRQEERISRAAKAQERATDRRSRAAANQMMRDAKYPLYGRDAKLSTIDKVEIQKARENWQRVDQFEKMAGKSRLTEKLKQQAHNQAEKVRIRNGYSGGGNGFQNYVPDLSEEEQKLSSQAQANLRVLKLYYEYGKRNGDQDIMSWASSEAEKIREPVKSATSSAVSWADQVPQDREYLEAEVEKAQQAVDQAKRNLRAYTETIRGTSTFNQGSNQTLARLQAALREKEAALEEAKRRVERVDYVDNYNEKTYQETGNKWSDFWSQFKANLDLGRISQDASIAYNEYLKNPTAANKAYAEALAELERDFSSRNSDVLDDEGKVLPWISDSLANYLPQFKDQAIASLTGAAGGAAAGAGVGFLAGGVGTIPGAIWGARAGAVAGSGKYSYDTMRGAAYRNLIEAGVDEATAMAAANDEAVISSLIEMADTGFDILTFGVSNIAKLAGKGVLKKAGNEAAETAAKKIAKSLGKYGLNIGSEMLEEGTQQAVTIANADRLKNGESGTLNLAKEASKVFAGAVTGDNPSARDEIWEAAKVGGQIAAMMGGAGAAYNAAANKAVSSIANGASDKTIGKNLKAQGTEAVQAVIEEGMKREDTAYLAAPLSEKLQNGKTVGDKELGKLVRAIAPQEQSEAETGENVETAQEAVSAPRGETPAKAEETTTAEAKTAPAETSQATDPANDILTRMAQEMTAQESKSRESADSLGYGRYGTQTFSDLMEQKEMGVDELKSRFKNAYEAGLANTPRDRVSLISDIQEKAYTAGRKDYILTMNQAEDGSQYATIYGKESGFIRTEAAEGVDQTLVSRLHTMSQALGIKTMFVDTISTESDEVKAGGYMTKDGVLVIARDASNPYTEVVKHEITHRMQQLSPKEYMAFRDYAVQQEADANGAIGTTVVEKYQALYEKGGKTLTAAEAMDEIAADFAEKLLKDEKTREDLAEAAARDNNTRTMAQKFFDAVREFIQKIKKAFSGDKAKMDKAAREEFGASIAELEKAERLWKQAYQAAADRVKSEHRTENKKEENAAASIKESGAKFSLKDSEMPVKLGDEAAVVEEDGRRFSLKSMNHDIAEGKMFSDLVEAGVFTKAQATRLKKNLNEIIRYMAPNADILDMNEAYGKDDRPYKAYKPNSDPLYVISLDFSTLCRKRLMTQYVIEQLQLRENRPMTAEEQIAIRSMLLDYRKQEQGLQVACAMCYVEAARLKSPKQMETYFKNTEQVLTKYFAMKNKGFNAKVKKAQEDFKTSHGYQAKDPKSAMTGAHRKAFDQMSDRMRKSYEPNDEERAIIETAKNLPRSTYLTAANLTRLNVEHPEIYDAYTTYIRNATRSKSLESDIPYYYGDSEDVVSDTFIENVNAENGMRFDSWSDFQMKHMLDMITAVIELSVRGSKMHGYTKFPEMVRIFGKTGMQFNLSGVTEGDGFDANGNLVFSSVEGMSKEDAVQLRKDFPDTAGFQCIGVSDDHIRALLRADYIDYVIPYHISGMNKTMRRMAGIYKWNDYTKEQHANKDPKAKKPEGAENWQVEPVWSEFYVKDGENGLDIMQKTAQRYIEMCRERGLIPKFEKFMDEPGYWKLLVDRKMINQKTGEIIEQKPVRPDFDFKLIKREIDREVAEYDAGLEQRALDYVVNNFDAVNTRIQDLKKQKTKEQMQTLGNEILQAYAQGTEGAGGKRFSLKSTKALEEENEKLRAVNAELKEQFKTTEFAKVDGKSLDRLTKRLLEDYSSNSDRQEIRDGLDDLYTYMANGERGDTSWAEAQRRAYDVAISVLETASETDDSISAQYKKLRRHLKVTGISRDTSYQNDLTGYEDLRDFQRQNRGLLKIVKDGGTPVGVLYHELATDYPELFDETAHMRPGDQLVHIAEVLNDLQPTEFNPYSWNMQEAATWLANDIMERFFELPQAKPTFADKAEAKLTRQVIRDAKKLERLREQKNERIARIIADNREKVKKVQATERSKRYEAVKQVKEHYKSKEAKASESRKARELRDKIMRHASDLSQKLLRPSDKQHIPQNLQGAVAKLLESINLESNYSYDPDTMHEVIRKDGKSSGVTGKHVPADDGLPTKRTLAFTELRKVYTELANELVVDPDLMGDEGLLSEVIGMADKRIADMSLSELDTIWKTMRAIEATISTANKMFSRARWETISEIAENIRAENAGKKEKTELDGPGGILGKAQKLTGLDMMTPEAFFHRLGKTGDGIFRMMRNAQDAHIRMMKEVSDFTHEELKKVNVNKLEKEMHKVTLGGEELQLSTAQIMELYVLMRREQAKEHILIGGILPDVVSRGKLKKLSKAKPVRSVTPEEVSKAVSLLTDEQRSTADTLQEYASTTLSKWGNEASMQVYNYEKFGEKNYWPIRVNRQETKSDTERDTAVTSVAERGFTKGTKPHANNSVMLGSIFDTFATHSSEMATYAAWLGTTEDINRIRNYTFRDDGKTTVDTVKGIIDTVHGRQGSKYLEKLLSDIAIGIKGTHGETEFTNSLVGNYKAAAIGANLRVIVQQPTAILRAMDMLGPQYFPAGMVPSGGWKKAVKYAPIAQWKDWGYFDISTGRQMKDVLFESDSKLEKVKEASMWGTSKADSVSWGLLWNACEAEVKSKQKSLEPKSEAFYEAVAERFTEIVDHTQVVDGILQRSQIMRSSSSLNKMATSFMGEPTKQYNMLLTAAYDAKTAKGRDKVAAKKKLARTVFSLAVSGVVNAMAQSIMDGVRDDDKDKDYLEKVLSAFLGLTGEEEGVKEHVKAVASGNLVNMLNPAAYIPYLKDVLSMLQGYDVSRMDMESVEKTITAFQNMMKALAKDGKYTIPAASANLFAEAARLIGIPVANLKREVKSFAMLAFIETDNYWMQYQAEKASLSLNYSGNNSTFLDILYNAYKNDTTAYNKIYKDMIDGGFDPEKIKSGMEKRMMDDQGVKSVKDLDQRYVTPDKKKEYNSLLSGLENSSVWSQATEDQRDKVKAKAYDLAMDTKSGESMAEKIGAGSEYGIDEADYLLYELAASVADQPNENGELGSYTSAERATAIISTGLSDAEMAYLWFQGQSGSESQKSTEVFDALNKGISIRTYLEFKAFESVTYADKDANGKSISGSKKEKVVRWLNENNVGQSAYNFIMYDVMGYKS